MKILVISEAYPAKNRPHSGFFVQKLVRAISQKGHDVMVICPRGLKSNLQLKAYREKSITVEYPIVPTAFRNSRSKLLFEAEFEIAARICLSRVRAHGFEPDLVYAHFAFGSGVIASKLSKALGVSFALMLGESSLSLDESRKGHRAYSVKATIEKANLVMCVSRKLAAQARGIVVEDKIKYVPNGVDLEIFGKRDKNLARERYGVPLHGTVFGYVGSISERKGFSVLQSLSNSLGSDFKLMIATGSGSPPIPTLYSGFVENDDLPNFLAACDYFLFPTQAEGMSNALLEAMACGLVVITSDTDFNREFLNERNSVLLNFSDAESFVPAIRAAIRSPEAFSHLGEKAKLDAQRFSLARRANTVNELITILYQGTR